MHRFKEEGRGAVDIATANAASYEKIAMSFEQSARDLARYPLLWRETRADRERETNKLRDQAKEYRRRAEEEV